MPVFESGAPSAAAASPAPPASFVRPQRPNSAMGWYRSNGWSGYGDQGWKAKYYSRSKESPKEVLGILEVRVRERPDRKPVQKLWQQVVGDPMGAAKSLGQWAARLGWQAAKALEALGKKAPSLRQAIMSFLEQFITQSGENEDMDNLKAKAAELQGELAGRRAKSVQVGAATQCDRQARAQKGNHSGAQGKVNDLGEQLRKAEAQLDELNTEVAGLEEKEGKHSAKVWRRTQTRMQTKTVTPRGDTEYPPPDTRLGPRGGERGKRKGKNKFRGKSQRVGRSYRASTSRTSRRCSKCPGPQTGGHETSQSEEKIVEFTQELPEQRHLSAADNGGWMRSLRGLAKVGLSASAPADPSHPGGAHGWAFP